MILVFQIGKFIKFLFIILSILLIFSLPQLSAYSKIASFTSLAANTTDEGNALLKWKQSFENESQALLTSWRENLNLSKNKFDGNIPSEFSQSQPLESLDLSGNLLIGTIPTVLGKLKRLQWMDLSCNSLSGTIPSSFEDSMSSLSSPIVHRDISSKNVLLDLEYEAHLSDFGTAKFLQPAGSQTWTTFAGTYGYSAPGLTIFLEIEVVMAILKVRDMKNGLINCAYPWCQM